jgi:hypothetical protein
VEGTGDPLAASSLAGPGQGLLVQSPRSGVVALRARQCSGAVQGLDARGRHRRPRRCRRRDQERRQTLSPFRN